MNSEDLVENMKNQNHKLESELKIKVELLNHLIYENDTLLSENKKLLEMNTQEKSTVAQLESRIKTLTGDLDEINYLGKLIIKLEEANKELKVENEQQQEVIKEMKELENCRIETPINLEKIEYQYNCQIQDLTDENKSLATIIESKVNEINNLKKGFNHEREIFQSKIENYKELLVKEKETKEEIESELISLQNDLNQPDFNKQGNNMYFEVEERRILAEKRVLEYQVEFQALQKSNSELRLYLEKAFDAYSELKEEELRDFKRNILEENAKLVRENRSLSNYTKEISDYMTEELLKYRETNGMNESGAIAALRIQLSISKGKITSVEEEIDRSHMLAEERKNKLLSLYKANDKMTKEIASLKSKIEKYESQLGWFNKIIPKNKLYEYEEQQKKLEESLSIKLNKSGMANNLLPLDVFGQYYASAKFSDKLVFDPFGNPISNKLTKKILQKTINNTEETNAINEDMSKPVIQSNFGDTKELSLRLVEKNDKIKSNIDIKDKPEPTLEEGIKGKSENVDKENHLPINEPQEYKSGLKKIKCVEVPEDVPECTQC